MKRIRDQVQGLTHQLEEERKAAVQERKAKKAAEAKAKNPDKDEAKAKNPDKDEAKAQEAVGCGGVGGA